MKSKKNRRRVILSILAIIVLALIIWIWWGNSALELNTFTLSSSKLPPAFDGYRIAHISDLHNTEMGDNNEKLLAMLREAAPDMIAITGDLIDSRDTDVQIALSFAEEAMKIAPCYYVPGNHEARVSEYPELRNGLTELGVVLLENDQIELEIGDARISLLGVCDPNFLDETMEFDAVIVDDALQTLAIDPSQYTILLSHRPELLDTYAKHGVDLVLSGHAHGGQVRIPFVGGAYAPHQGLFPDYDSGLYTKGSTNMIVSRGIGNSLFPVRVNDRPEVILIVLEGV